MNKRGRYMLISTILTLCTAATGGIFFLYGRSLCMKRHPSAEIVLSWNDLFEDLQVVLPLAIITFWALILLALEFIFIVHRRSITLTMMAANALVGSYILGWTKFFCGCYHYEYFESGVKDGSTFSYILLLATVLSITGIVTYRTMTKWYYNYWTPDEK